MGQRRAPGTRRLMDTYVEALRKGGHTVGMCGDGANDAPVLRRHRRSGQPAHPALCAKLHHQEDRYGALPDRRPDHDRHAILTPLLMVIVMIAGDFLSMSLTTDNLRPSPMPNAWRIGSFAGLLQRGPRRPQV